MIIDSGGLSVFKCSRMFETCLSAKIGLKTYNLALPFFCLLKYVFDDVITVFGVEKFQWLIFNKPFTDSISTNIGLILRKIIIKISSFSYSFKLNDVINYIETYSIIAHSDSVSIRRTFTWYKIIYLFLSNH